MFGLALLTSASLVWGSVFSAPLASAAPQPAGSRIAETRLPLVDIPVPTSCVAPFVFDFGAGPNYSGPLDPTDTTYTWEGNLLGQDGLIQDGEYSLMSALSDAAGGWWHIGPDHTPGDTDGLMMVVNADFSPGIFFQRTFTNLSPGALYDFSAWLTNANDVNTPILPNVQFRVVDPVTNDVLASIDTGDISNKDSMVWERFALQFTATQSTVRLEIANNAPGGSGNDLALDDITFSPACDFGDAPASYGTTIADDGAGHIASGPTLGGTRDPDPDGQPNAAADGDGDDGVVAPIRIAVGAASTTVTVSATNNSNQDVTLAGWVDLDGNGTFDAGERVMITVPANSGTADYDLVVPAVTTTVDTYARFRIYGEVVADPQPTGTAAAGEVEDYLVGVYSTTVVKEPLGTPQANADGSHTVQFRITVTRDGEGPGYDLQDTFNAGASIVIDSASAENADPGTIAPLNEWDAATGTLRIVDDQPIADGVTHVYVVTVTAEVDGESLTYGASDCALAQGESGTGLLNTAQVAAGGATDGDSACVEPFVPEIQKKTVGTPTPIGDGLYEVVYEIEVINRHAGAGEYDLDDRLMYGDAVTVVGQPQAVAVTGTVSALENTWDAGAATLRLQENEAIAAATGPGSPTVHTYRVTVRYQVNAAKVSYRNSDCSLTGAENGTGLMNRARVTVDQQTTQGRGCAKLSEAVHKKVVRSGPSSLGNNRFRIQYAIKVTNRGAAATTYSLEDRLRYGGAVRILDTGATVVPGSVDLKTGWNGDSRTALVADQRIRAGRRGTPTVHTYLVTVDFRVKRGAITSRNSDCSIGDAEAGTGLLNLSVKTTNGKDATDTACRNTPNPPPPPPDTGFRVGWLGAVW